MAPTSDSREAGRAGFSRAAVLIAMALGAACAGGQPPGAPATGGASVEALVGDAACESDAQCHTIGVGAKACGGPQRYLAWSSLRTDGAVLRSVAEREARAARAQAEAAGVMSNCSVTIDPGAYCAAVEPPGKLASSSQARQCKTRSAGSGGATQIY